MLRRFFNSASTIAATSRLQDKVAIITGVASGIGRECSLSFAREGVKGLLLADLNEVGGQETLKLLKEQSPNIPAMFLQTDVSQSEQCATMVNTAEKEFGNVNILFNNAGVMINGDGDEQETTDEIWDRTFNVNVKGVWYGCKYGIPALKRAGGGSIINTASFVALKGAATAQLAYTASKGAVLALTRELAIVHAKSGIRINGLCPGPLHTDTEEKKHRRLVHLPMGRFGYASEMASAVVFLASDESSYITGTDFLVDGGLNAAYVTAE